MMLHKFLKFFNKNKFAKITRQPVKMKIADNTQEIINEFAAEHKLNIVDLSDKILSFRFDAYCCYFLNEKVCPLSLTENELTAKNIPESNTLDRGHDVYFCRKMLESMQTKEGLEKLFLSADASYIIKKECGHYQCNGQHRLCIAKHLGLLIPVDVQKDTSIKCEGCRERRAAEYALFE